MESDPKCRFCAKDAEDGYHLLFHCKELPNNTEMEQLRQGQFILNRQSYHKWLFDDESLVQNRRYKLIATLLQTKIKI